MQMGKIETSDQFIIVYGQCILSIDLTNQLLDCRERERGREALWFFDVSKDFLKDFSRQETRQEFAGPNQMRTEQSPLIKWCLYAL